MSVQNCIIAAFSGEIINKNNNKNPPKYTLLTINLSSVKDQGVKVIFSNLVFVKLEMKGAAGE